MEKRKEDANFRLNFENFKEVLNNAPHTSERITSKSILAMPTFTGKKTDFKFYKNTTFSIFFINLQKCILLIFVKIQQQKTFM